MVQSVKYLPAMLETWVQPPGQEDPLEEGMAVHSSILAWRILWTEQPGGLQSIGSQRVRQDCSYVAHKEATFKRGKELGTRNAGKVSGELICLHC